MKRRQFIWSSAALSIGLAGCMGNTNPDDIDISNRRNSTVQYQIGVEDSTGAEIFNESGEITASGEETYEGVFTPEREYTVFVSVNGSEQDQMDYRHLDHTGVWIEICEDETHLEAITTV